MSNKFEDMMIIAKENNEVEGLSKILDEYFEELEKYHPTTYSNLMKEVYKLGAKVNIANEEELNEVLKHINHPGTPELWTVEQTTKVGEDIGINFNEWRFNPYTFNFVMNMVRADYYDEFKSMFSTSPLMKQTILDSPSFYAHIAKAWLNDEDAPSDKAIRYIHYIMDVDLSEV